MIRVEYTYKSKRIQPNDRTGRDLSLGAEGEKPLLAKGEETLRQKYRYMTGLWRVSRRRTPKGKGLYA